MRNEQAMTIIARAPVRISFGGGGTDLPAYYERHGGLVVSAAITRFATVVATPSADGWIGLNSADLRCWDRVDPGAPIPLDGPLSLPKGVLAWFRRAGVPLPPVDLFMASEVPPGSGLGSSSAMAVALVRALAATVGWDIGPAEAAKAACEVEIDLLGRPIGRQDQYAASFGGINAIRFGPDRVAVEPLPVAEDTLDRLSDWLLLLSTGRTRDSAEILHRQRASTQHDARVCRNLDEIKQLAVEMRLALVDDNLGRFGTLLDEGWRMKRSLASGISDGEIDRWYARAREAGALGGKITGAGGGGFLLLCVAPARRAEVERVARADGLVPLAFEISREGAHTSCLVDRTMTLTGAVASPGRGGVR